MNSGKTVALDIGGVCISLHVDLVLKGLGLTPGALLSQSVQSACMQFETGRMSNERMLMELRKVCSRNLTDAELTAVWNSMLGESKPGMAEAVGRAVERGWQFIYFSNTSGMHMDYFLKTNDFAHLISGAVFSYQVGAMKPDDAMYEAFEKKYGVPAFYFDDTLKNVEAGRKHGWNAIHFHSPEQIDQLLK